METVSAANWWVLVLTSGAVGALVSSIINGFVSAWTIKKQTSVRKMEIALKLMEMKQDQIRLLGELQKQGYPSPIDLYDPAYSLLVYVKAVDEIESSRTWKLGEANVESLLTKRSQER